MTKRFLPFVLLCSLTLFYNCDGKDEPQPDPTPKVIDSEDAEVMPTFQDGDYSTFRTWVYSQVKYPKEASSAGIEGVVKSQFTVSQTGSVTNITILESPSEILSKEVIRVLDLSPDWEPGMQKGKPVNIRFTLPVNFVLN